MRVVGLYREAECSPGRHRSNDARLLELVGESLGERGLTVDLLTIDAAARGRHGAALLFSMCQGRAALDALALWEIEGARIVNSPRAASNTYRNRLPALMRDAGVPFPDTDIVATGQLLADRTIAAAVGDGVWLKRGDVHASVSADVQRIDSAEALQRGLRDFAARGVRHAALQQHRPGAELKFYGVAGGAFFHWFVSAEAPGVTAGAASTVDVAALRRLAEDAAAAAGLEIFGGDVIVGPSGALTLIDLNDWPSFAPCRHQAAGAIADSLMRRVDAAWSPGLVSSAKQSAV